MAWVRRQVQLLVCAVQFLTRVPTPALKDFQPDWITRSARYFPLVGQGVGVLSAAVFFAAYQVWSPTLAALLAVGAGLIVTGAFHEDGLADTADGLGGGQTAERRLEIMKDSRVGTYGVCALVLVLALKIAALSNLSAQAGVVTLIAAHGAGRAAALVAMRLTPYAPMGAAGKWKPTPQGVRASEVVIGLLIAAWPLVLLSPSAVMAGLTIGGLGALAAAVAAQRLIGGHTGDVLGAIEQLFEAGFILGVAALA